MVWAVLYAMSVLLAAGALLQIAEQDVEISAFWLIVVSLFWPLFSTIAFGWWLTGRLFSK